MALVWQIILALCLELIIDRTEAQQGYACEEYDVAFVVGYPAIDANFGYLRESLFQLTVLLKSNLHIFGSNDTGKVALVTFGETARVEFLLNRFDNFNDVLGGISDVRPSGERPAALKDALKLVREEVFVERNGDRPDVDNLVILITDGLYDDRAEVENEAEQLTLVAGIITIAVTDQPSILDGLVALTDDPDSVFNVTNYSSILRAVYSIRKTPLCRYTLVSDCFKKMDLVLILDESTSIAVETNDNWKIHMLGFAKNVVEKFKIGREYSRVAVVTFSSTARVPIYLDSHFDMKNLTNAIGNLTIRGGNTNIAEALRKTRTQIFRTARGFRKEVAHVIVLITDGKDQEGTDILDREIALLKETGAQIFVVGITNEVDEEQLRQIASDPVPKHLFRIDEFHWLNLEVNRRIFPPCPEEESLTSIATHLVTPSK